MDAVTQLVRARRLGPSGDGRQVREAAGLSVRELADAIGVEAATLSRWETGRSRPRRLAALRWLAIVDSLGRDACEPVR